jgi:hypothetical protein
MIHFAGKFRYYLEGPQTSTNFTDHKPLVTFLTSNTHKNIYARWAQLLQSLNVRVVYTRGTKNTAADGLSRTIFNLSDCAFIEKYISCTRQRRNMIDKSGSGSQVKGAFRRCSRVSTRKNTNE